MNKEEFQFYYYILYSVTAFVALIFSLNLDFKNLNYRRTGIIFSFLFTIAFLFLFGSRGEEVGTDTSLYLWQFDNYNILSIDVDFLYSFLLIILNKFTNNGTVFLFTMAAINLLTLWWTCLKIANKKYNVYFLLFSFYSLFFFQTLGINIIRQGIGLSFFLLGVSFYLRHGSFTRKMLISFLIAVGFHFTTIIPVILFVLIVYFRKINISFYYGLYFIALILSFFKVSILNFASYFGFLLIDERRGGYLRDINSDIYDVGFKPQFVIFNTFFLLISRWIYKNNKVEENYTIQLKYYLIMSSLFFLTFQIAYSDRWGVMSWMMIPLLILPLFDGKKTSLKFATVCSIGLILIFIYFNSL